MGLTEKQIKALKPESKRYRVAAGGGLIVEVRPGGEKFFIKKYRFNQKARTDILGQYPSMKLTEAQVRSVEISYMVKKKIDPRADLERVRKVAAQMIVDDGPAAADKVLEKRRFEVIARKFINKRINDGIAAATIDKLNWNLGGVASKHFQGRDIASIKAPEVVELIEAIQATGKWEKAKDIHRKLNQTFDYAIALGLSEFNPAAHIKRALASKPSVPRPGFTNPTDVGGLMRSIRVYPDTSGQATRAALVLSAYCFLRSTELRGARWVEIDFDEAVWTVPHARMKPPCAGDHLVPLSRQALTIFEHLHLGRAEGEEFVFPAPKKPGRFLSEATLQSALRIPGSSGQ